MATFKEVLKNSFLAPFSSLLGIFTALCQGTDLGQTIPEVTPYCGLVASLLLIFARFK